VTGALGGDPGLRKLSGHELPQPHYSPELLLAMTGELGRDPGIRKLSGQSLSKLSNFFVLEPTVDELLIPVQRKTYKSGLVMHTNIFLLCVQKLAKFRET
jgi:hypothetical protein